MKDLTYPFCLVCTMAAGAFGGVDGRIRCVHRAFPLDRLAGVIMPKITAILNGGDWADASVEHLVIPPKLDIEFAQDDYTKWYRNVYLPAPAGRRRYLTFSQWLIEHCGARYTTEDELSIVEFGCQ